MRGGQCDRASSSYELDCKPPPMRMVVVGCGVMYIFVIQFRIPLYRVLLVFFCLKLWHTCRDSYD